MAQRPRVHSAILYPMSLVRVVLNAFSRELAEASEIGNLEPAPPHHEPTIQLHQSDVAEESEAHWDDVRGE